MQLNEALVLAGGLGTRLRSAIPDLPKCMAPVNGRPFLGYIIDYFIQQGIDSFVFSLGYKHELISSWLHESYKNIRINCIIEDRPLGTGGAIQFALPCCNAQRVIVLNGDTLFKVSVKELGAFHEQHAAECTLSLKPMTDFDRYGVVETDDDGRIISFKEKMHYEKGLINGGVYVFDHAVFERYPMPEVFSFEKDYLETSFAQQPLYGCVQEGYFIDIGIPEDYARAAIDLKEGAGEL